MSVKFTKMFVLSALLFLFNGNAVFAAQALDKIVAVVGDSVITQSQIDQQRNLLLAQMQQSNTPIPATRELNKKILDDLIGSQLAMQLAKEKNINITDQQLNQTITNIAAQNNMSMAQLQTAVTQKGLDWKDYQQQIRKQLTLNILQRQMLTQKISVSAQDIKNYLTAHATDLQEIQYHLQGILVPLAANANTNEISQAQRQANTIVASLKTGANFDINAINESTGQKLQGGDMGWRTISQFPPALGNLVITAKPGAVFGPLQTPQGFYIFKFFAQQTVPMQHFSPQAQINRILIKGTNDAARAKIATIQTQLSQGVAFAKLASQYSVDPKSAKNGGSLGWITPNDLSPAEDAVINQLKPGQVSKPIQLPGEFSIIQLIALRQVNDTQSYLNAMAKQAIYQEKMDQATQAWYLTLRKGVYIKLYN